MDIQTKKFGARVAFLSEDTFLVEQTHYSEEKGRYVIEHRDGNKCERHVKADNDTAIGAALRDAARGEL